MESLLGVDASFEWSRPGGGVDGGSLLFRVCQVLPIDQESDGVFGFGSQPIDVAIPVVAEAVTFVGLYLPSTIQQWI
jgi:hypothetical protein